MNAEYLKNIGSHEVVILLLDGDEPDGQGKQVFTAFWRDDHFPGNPAPPCAFAVRSSGWCYPNSSRARNLKEKQ